MPPTSRIVHALLALALVVLPACERGCLSRELAGAKDADPLMLDWVDCPDGLARCVDGRLERSKLATVDPRRPGGCPWEPIGACPGPCVEGVSLPEAHARQLCRDADGGATLLAERPTTRCPTEGPRWACVASRVIDCERGVAIATCLRGCAQPELEDDLEEGDARLLLCAR